MKRDAKGRFVKGHSGNPNGRSKKEIEQDYMDATIRSVSIGDWEAIVLKAIAQAKKGDTAARKWLGDNLVGLPTQRIDLKHKGKVLVWDWKRKEQE